MATRTAAASTSATRSRSGVLPSDIIKLDRMPREFPSEIQAVFDDASRGRLARVSDGEPSA
jgi:hypothetical protein